MEKRDNGFIIEKKFIYGGDTPDKKLINLGLIIGIDTRYEDLDYTLLDYPGEYDIKGIGIKCFVGKGDKLNYIIQIKNKKIGIFQSPEVLDNDEVGDVDVWYYTEDRVEKKLDQLELEWEKLKLE